ncbi:MAG TPA: VCBS repeat domain-containing M23 family metallopeptidase [Vicinamibacterales bacterium]|nr:VCBS repeat domain-containing M23 family metallopeptidase [Vicinamibacterales bacterium]
MEARVNSLGRRIATVGVLGVMSVVAFASAAAAQSRLPTGFYFPLTTFVSTGCSYWLARDAAHGGCYPFNGYYHLGYDIRAAAGSPVFAVSAGTVAKIESDNAGNIAMYVRHTLSDGSAFHAMYGHVRSTLRVGDTVLAGATIATVGPYASTASHLHFGISPGAIVPPGSYEIGINAYWPSTNGFADPLNWIMTKSPASVSTARLTVAVTGSGVVTSSQSGISCGAGATACSADFMPGTSVTLTTSASAGWTFAGWSGSCSGSSACVVAMTTARTVNATFVPATGTVGAFGKTGPVNANTKQAAATVLTWSRAANATSYEICIDTTNNLACDTGWSSVGTNTMAAPAVSLGVTYYWQVRARGGTAVTESDGGVWWRFTTKSGSRFVCDVNYDGRADLIWQRSSDGAAAAWYMAGTSATGGVAFPVDAAFGAAWKIVGAGDFNADMACDLLFQHTDGRLTAWMMDSTRRWGVLPLSPAAMTDPDTKLRAVTDINGDGFSDLIWQKESTGVVTAWLMNGTTRVDVLDFAPQQESDLGWKLMAAADMNQDGYPDLIWQHDQTRAVSVWLMVGSVRQESRAIATIPTAGWVLQAVGDTNWDGRPEIFWRHPTTGAIGVWIVNGLAVSQVVTPLASSDLAWRIVGPR